ncbi:MAG: hypothetical protein ACYC2Y_08345 [Armatimonadota bacterium]
MALSDAELAQRASERYSILVMGDDAVFIADRMLGQKVHMGPSISLSRPDFRRYVTALNGDLDALATREFFEKYRLIG